MFSAVDETMRDRRGLGSVHMFHRKGTNRLGLYTESLVQVSGRSSVFKVTSVRFEQSIECFMSPGVAWLTGIESLEEENNCLIEILQPIEVLDAKK
jgi:hypothetical protein